MPENQGNGLRSSPEPKNTIEKTKSPTEIAVTSLLRETGLFGNYTPKGDNPTYFPIKTMQELQYLIGTRAYKKDHEKELGERGAPYKGLLKRVEMAYEVLAFPRLHLEGYAPKGLVRDAQEHPNQDVEEFPHRAPIELNEDEIAILGSIAKPRDLPFNPEKRVYSYTERVARLDAAEQETMRKFGEIARGNAIDAGILRNRHEIEEEIRQRQEKWRASDADQSPSSEPPESDK